ncbi:MAG: high frequency lysogenization protein HflD [Gammaproteobacteria bacterium]|nr:high frequency lysogenization protein HflD [Gammaproteobacteria bacterium]
MASLYNKTLALAGIFQSCALVQQVATTGQLDTDELEVCLKSIVELNPDDLVNIYGAPENLRTGLKLIVSQFGANDSKPDIDIARYTISLLHLEKKLAKHPQMLQRISDGVERAKEQLEHFPITHENIIANLASIYSDTISQIPPKIMVSGDNQYLGDNNIANKIRALLLSGMRSAVLWRQMGGSRWQLLMQRKKLVQQAEHILSA